MPNENLPTTKYEYKILNMSEIVQVHGNIAGALKDLGDKGFLFSFRYTEHCFIFYRAI
jgi:hypothetical protein